MVRSLAGGPAGWRRGGALLVSCAVLALAPAVTGCRGGRSLPPPRPAVHGATPTASERRQPSPTPTVTPPEPGRPPGPPTAAPPAAADSLPPGAPTEVVTAARMTDAARRDLAAGETDRALELLERAVQVAPAAPFPYYFMAETYLARGRADEALVLAQRAATLAAAYPTAWAGHAHVLRGRALESLDRGGEARDAYRAALAVDPNNLAARRALGDAGL